MEIALLIDANEEYRGNFISDYNLIWGSDANGLKSICKKIDNENYTILKGTVIYDEMFYKYVKSLTENENVTFLGKGTSDNGEGYYYYKINDDGTEKFNYIVWIQKSSTAILLEGGNDQKETEKAFEHLTFKPYYSSD